MAEREETPVLIIMESQKGLDCVGADVHPIRNLLAAQAFATNTPILLARVGVRLNCWETWDNETIRRDLFQAGRLCWGEQDFCLRIHDERTAKITPPAGSELGHKGRSTWGLSVRQARGKSFL